MQTVFLRFMTTLLSPYLHKALSIYCKHPRMNVPNVIQPASLHFLVTTITLRDGFS